MKRLLMALVVAITMMLALAAPAGATHGANMVICDASYFADIQAAWGTACTPVQGDDLHWRMAQAAMVFWNSQTPASPRTTEYGNPGAQGYAIPGWCKDAQAFGYYFPHGVQWGWTTGVAHAGYEGQPPSGSGQLAGQANPYACAIALSALSSPDGEDYREMCLEGIHEYGHTIGWGHNNGPYANSPPLHVPTSSAGRLVMDRTKWWAWPQKAHDVCWSYGFGGGYNYGLILNSPIYG